MPDVLKRFDDDQSLAQAAASSAGQQYGAASREDVEVTDVAAFGADDRGADAEAGPVVASAGASSAGIHEDEEEENAIEAGEDDEEEEEEKEEAKKGDERAGRGRGRGPGRRGAPGRVRHRGRAGGGDRGAGGRGRRAARAAPSRLEQRGRGASRSSRRLGKLEIAMHFARVFTMTQQLDVPWPRGWTVRWNPLRWLSVLSLDVELLVPEGAS